MSAEKQMQHISKRTKVSQKLEASLSSLSLNHIDIFNSFRMIVFYNPGIIFDDCP
jgi:hypothetical protein